MNSRYYKAFCGAPFLGNSFVENIKYLFVNFLAFFVNPNIENFLAASPFIAIIIIFLYLFLSSVKRRLLGSNLLNDNYLKVKVQFVTFLLFCCSFFLLISFFSIYLAFSTIVMCRSSIPGEVITIPEINFNNQVR